ncbi:heme lyase CcmF/NrfE family subunit [Dongia soli]|uniref:Heme lyase CcmF/NrfE family subunit n=1 Tax=Dongia soli TaxID=600628 RepID=A0ABU5EIF6_9PROT|nr:heme lyase CcmF/NrfE family subunit [Dongia soli]MDY0885900.1 heme lyase CcmF/NrfE family subunit [Dongia soli]
MITELGHYALVLALVLALAQSVIPLVGAQRNLRPWMALAQPAAVGQFFLLGLSFLALVHAYVVSDFSVAAVYENSHSAQPLIYKVAAAWGNHEGSLLLWVLILGFFGALVAAFGNNLPLRLKSRVLAVQAMISTGFLVFMLLTSNPFARLGQAPLEGRQLNPMLQDPGLAFHPPMLYLGYVGLSMSFSFAIAALLEGSVDAAWARWVRPWTLLSWTTLTCGIVLGSRWAYYELGWGGWWYWDPVENASFMPWLIATALLHSAIVVEKRDSLKAWTILLAILGFAFSMLGTFLVRSGVITSVHAFAQDPARGIFILALLAIAIGGSLSLFAWRAPILKPGGFFAPISREGSLVLNNLLLAVLAATVLFGTLAPLILNVMNLGTISVGPPYFQTVFVPIAMPLVLIAAIGPFLGWKRGDLPGALQRLAAAGIAAAIAIGFAWYMADGASFMALAGMALAAWLFIGTLIEWAGRVKLGGSLGASWSRAIRLPRSAYGMTLAHAGLAVAIVGMTGSIAWKQEKVAVLHVGQSIEVGDTSYRLDDIRKVTVDNYLADRATIVASQNGQLLALLTPERRQYLVPSPPTTESAIHSNFARDVYVVVGEPDGQGGWTVRIYVEPLVLWIWLGGGLMALGGVVSLTDRRYRVGAPSKMLARKSEVAARA